MYIAHSMAYETVSEKSMLFHTVEELLTNAEAFKIKFGALKGGATESFFKVSKYLNSFIIEWMIYNTG